MLLRWVTLLVWALVAASAVAWGFRLFTSPAPAPAATRVADAGAAAGGDLGPVLGADATPAPAATDEPAPSAASARFQLLGVVAPRTTRPVREGVALIAVDGNPPRAYRIGARIDDSVVLQAVRARGAELGPRDGKPTVVLEIPPPAPPATGVLPPVRVGAPTAPAAAAPPAAPGGVVPRPPVPTSLAPLQSVPPPPGVVVPQPMPVLRAQPGDGGDDDTPRPPGAPEARAIR